MNELLLEILKSNSVTDEKGHTIPLHSAISVEEANFISDTIRNNGLKKAVEVGCAMGISSLAIADTLQKTAGSQHYIIDPNQKSQWNNQGIYHLRKAGFNNFNLVEDYSEFALPALVKQGLKFDFAFIDGWHTFDHTLLDFFYVNRMLEIGGVVIIDDVHMPAVSSVIRYVYNYPAYQYLGCIRNAELTTKRKIYEKAIQLLSLPKYLMGRKIAGEFFNSKALKPDRSVHLDCTMIALKKVAEDQRPWNWHENF